MMFISIGFPGDVGSVVSSIVLESDCTVVIEPISDGWLSVGAGNVSIPVLVDACFDLVDDASGGVGLIGHFASTDGVGNSCVSGVGAVWISELGVVVQSWWPGSVSSVVGSVVTENDWTVVVNPESDSSKTWWSSGKNIPSFVDSSLDAVHDTVDGIAFWDHLAASNTAIKGIGLVVWACSKETVFGIELNIFFDLIESVFQDEAQCEGDEQSKQNELFHVFRFILFKFVLNLFQLDLN